MTVDILTATVIGRPLTDVADFAADPSNAPTWYSRISSVEWITGPRTAEGARVRFVANFLGRQLQYTYELVELVPRRRLVMRTEEGPFPMETTYTWEAIDDETTRMTLRNRGEPAGFSRLSGILMVPAMRRANRQDLAALRRILERR